jgi:hypothetical protein
MKTTYVVQHLRSDPGEFDDLKFIGVYSTKQLALDAVDSHKGLPGFKDYPDGFDIAEYEIDCDYWTEGFVNAWQQLR